MYTREEILSRIYPAIAETLGIDENELTPESRFVDDLGVDSLDMVKLIMSEETEFGVNISDDDLYGIVTINDAVDVIMNSGKRAAGKEEQRNEVQKALDRLHSQARKEWAALEEKQAKEYISRTGLPYFTYDGIHSSDETAGSRYSHEKIAALSAGTYEEWILSKAGWFIGKPLKKLDEETVAEVLAFIESIFSEYNSHYDNGGFPRFRYGCHEIITPDGNRHGFAEMFHIAMSLRQDILSAFITPMLPENLQMNRIDGKGNGVLCTVSDAKMDFAEEVDIHLTYKVGGKGRPHTSAICIEHTIGEWRTLNRRYVFDPVGTESTRAFGKINSALRKIFTSREKRFLLERSAFVFGIFTKTISLPLAAKVLKTNGICSSLVQSGTDLFVTKDGRQHDPWTVLNPSAYLTRDVISYIIGRKGFTLNMQVDSEDCIFTPCEFASYYKAKDSIILKGTLYGASRPKTEIFEISLCGKKCYRTVERFLGFCHVKGDIRLVMSKKNKAVLRTLYGIVARVNGYKDAETKEIF
jgi:acyl carrier protein